VTVLAVFVEGVSVTEQADVVPAAGNGAQVVAEKVSPGTSDENVTRPAGLDFVPAGSTSARVAVTAVEERIVTGFGEKAMLVAVARGLTVSVAGGDEEAA